MASDDLDLELATMQTIATALGRLDAAAQSRVLMWLRLRFDPDVHPAEPAEAAMTAAPLRFVSIPTPSADDDDTLSVEGLAELFDRRDVRPPAEPAPQAAGGLLSELVAEFKDLARDWDRGCDTLAEEVQAPRALPAAS